MIVTWMPLQIIKFQFDKLFVIWKKCFIDNPSHRVKLNQLDDRITKRGVIVKDNQLFVQLNTYEVTYIKNLYEAII